MPNAMAYRTGVRIVQMVHEELTPSRIMTRSAFENAIVVTSAIGGSTNCPPHINAIAAHMGVPLHMDDWDRIGHGIGLLANVQPSGEYLGESFHRAGGVPAIMGELLAAGKLRDDALTVTGKTIGESYGGSRTLDHDVIRPYDDVLMDSAGFMVLSGNLFTSAIIKTSVLSDKFRERFLHSAEADADECFTARAVVFDGPEDYRKNIEDPALGITEHSILVVRNSGPVGYPGSAEVVNMTPPSYLVEKGVRMLPCLGDGRQSGTSDSPSIVNVSPEAAVGGNLAILQSGDLVRVNLTKRSVDMLVDDAEIARRKSLTRPAPRKSNTPWEEIFRNHVTQLEDGYYLDWATKYHDVARVVPRHSH
jgi:dihydroxyacid dehydratase/phosphogluconate dehydratase